MKLTVGPLDIQNEEQGVLSTHIVSLLSTSLGMLTVPKYGLKTVSDNMLNYKKIKHQYTKKG